jgi:acetyl esterase/lipase
MSVRYAHDIEEPDGEDRMHRTGRRRTLSLRFASLVLAVVAAAAPAAAAQPKPPSAARVITGGAYAPPQPATSQGHLLDLYLPAHARRRVPLVVWSHGSGWLAENGREGAAALAGILNPRGFAVAGVAIRSSANAQFPAQLFDMKAAIRWLRLNADRYRLAPDRFAIMGESSGGWTAAMAGVTGGVRSLEGNVGVRGRSSRVQAAIPFYPPTDFLQMDAHMLQNCVPFNAIFGLTDCHADPRSPESLLLGCAIASCPDRVARANPINYVDSHDPPFMILHGQQDLLVPYHQSTLLYHALRRACADATFFTLPDAPHGFVGDPPGLEDPAVTDGATGESTRRCRASGTRPLEPSWELISDWLHRELGGPRHRLPHRPRP